jgi:hypothetical protein
MSMGTVTMITTMTSLDVSTESRWHFAPALQCPRPDSPTGHLPANPRLKVTSNGWMTTPSCDAHLLTDGNLPLCGAIAETLPTRQMVTRQGQMSTPTEDLVPGRIEAKNGAVSMK